jgi:hypothetical protein
LPQVQKKRSERGGFPSERFVLKAFQTAHFTGFAPRQPVSGRRCLNPRFMAAAQLFDAGASKIKLGAIELATKVSGFI